MKTNRIKPKKEKKLTKLKNLNMKLVELFVIVGMRKWDITLVILKINKENGFR